MAKYQIRHNSKKLESFTLTSFPPGNDLNVTPYSSNLVELLKKLKTYMLFTDNDNLGYSIINGPRVVMRVIKSEDRWYDFKLRFYTNKEESRELIDSHVIHIFDNPMLVK